MPVYDYSCQDCGDFVLFRLMEERNLPAACPCCQQPAQRFISAPNLALIIGPYSPDLADPIRKAGGIIAANMASGRIPDDGFLLLASSPYEEIGADRARAELKARFLARFAADVIRRELPDLAGRMTVRTGVLNWATRALEAVGEP